jgi:hypothetical protein
MNASRWMIASILALGLASLLAFHSSGALSEQDALTVTSLGGGVATAPPSPVTSRAMELGARLVRVVWAPTGTFRAAHLGAGLWLGLAAVLSALLARRATSTPSVGFAAGLLVGSAVLFGGVTGGIGREAGPVAPLLALLAGACLCWTGDRLRPLLGGLLLGLAIADQPLALLLAPGFALLAREAAGRHDGFHRSAGLGLALGMLALLLPLADHRENGLLQVGETGGPLAALFAWLGTGTPAWTFGGPEAGIRGVLSVASAAWQGVGPVGLLLAIGGLVALVREVAPGTRASMPQAAPGAPAFVLMLVPLAAARFLGTPSDPALVDAWLGWCLALTAVPALAALAQRLGDDSRIPIVAAVAVLSLVATNTGRIDRSAEKGTEWAGTVVETLPRDAVLVTANPVQLALLADGLRPDVDAVYPPDGSSVFAYRTARELLPLGVDVPAGPLPDDVLRSLLSQVVPERPVLLDPSVYFDGVSKAMITEAGWTLSPHGLAFRLQGRGRDISNQEAGAAVLAWEDVNVHPGTPASDLRDGLTGGQYYARALLQSGVESMNRGRDFDAERDFLLALSHPDASTTLAAHGLAQVFFQRGQYRETIRTLEDWVDEDDPGAWVALKMLASAYALTRDRDRAIATLQRAIALLPPDLTAARADLQRSLDGLTRRAGS